MPEVTSFSLTAGQATHIVQGDCLSVATTAALERSDRGQWLLIRNAGRAAFRRQLELQGLSAGELNKRSAWFNTETSALELNDLFRFIRELLHGTALEAFLKEARHTILGEHSDSDSDL